MKKYLQHALIVGFVSLGFTACTTHTPPPTKTTEQVQLTDTEIFAIYDQVNGFDIVAAGIGIQKSQSPHIKPLAEMVMRDHTAVRKMTRELASKLQITYSIDDKNDMALQHQVNMEMLNAKSGRAFDEAYLKYEAKFHTDAIAAIETSLLPAIQDQEFKALVTDVLPGFKHHLSETLRVANLLGVAVD